MRRDFESALAHAREQEKRLAGYVRGRGFYLLPTYDFSGKGDDKAPKLEAPPGGRSLVVPDLLAWGPSESLWIECKWKQRADFYRKSGHRVTGISLRLWRHYGEVQRRTGLRVVIAFLHEDEGEVRIASLARLAVAPMFSHQYAGGKMGSSGMIFFGYDAIPLRAQLADLPADTTAACGGVAA